MFDHRKDESNGSEEGDESVFMEVMKVLDEGQRGKCCHGTCKSIR